jgi:hypothetical protein
MAAGPLTQVILDSSGVRVSFLCLCFVLITTCHQIDEHIMSVLINMQIPSDKIEFSKAPDMKALEITAASKEAILSGKYKVIRVNFANPDMVGHTGT